MTPIVLLLLLSLFGQVRGHGPVASTTITGRVTSVMARYDTNASGDRSIVSDVTIRQADGTDKTVTIEGGTVDGMTMRSSLVHKLPVVGDRITVQVTQKNGKTVLHHSPTQAALEIEP